MIDQLKPLIGKLTLFAKKRMGFQHPPRLFLRSDSENAQKMLGKTAHYDPQEKAVTLFTHNRHPKDILRSYAHELVHHTQNLRGDLSPEKCGEMGQGYAQANGHMREMEREAYEKGNMCFRDWEDTLNDKDTYIIIKIAESKNLKENKSMTTKITKEFLKETIRKILSEAEILKGYSDEQYYRYAQNNPKVQDTDRYKQIAPVIKLKQAKAAAIEKAKNPGGLDYDRLVGAAGAATKADRDKAMAAVAKEFDAQIAAVGKPSALNVNTAMASNMPAPGMGGGAQSFDDVLGRYDAKPAAASKPAAKKMSRRELIRKRGAQTERLLPKYKPFNISNIKELQRVLVYLDILPPLQDNGDPQDDGKYGGGTMGAVQELQRQIGIPEPKRDGVWGPATTKAIKMNSELMKKLKSSEMEAKLAGLPGAGDKGSIPGVDVPSYKSSSEDFERVLDNLDEKKAKPDYIDIDGDGNRKESMKKAAADKKKKKKKKTNETKIQTPEQENSLYESRFADRNNRLFENLSKKWTK